MTGADAAETPRAVADTAAAMIAVSAIFFLFGINVGMWAAHIPVVQSRLGIDTATLGLCLLGAAIGTIFGQPAIGILVARKGSRPVTNVMSVLAAIATVAAVTATTIVWLFLACVLIGITWGGLNVAVNTQGSQVEVLRARPTMSLFHAFASLGMLAGSAAGGLLIGAGWGGGKGAGATAAVLIVATIAVSRMLLDAPPQPRDAAFVLPNRAVLGLGVLALVMFLVEGGMVDWSALFLSVEKGATEAWAPIGFTVFTAAMTLFRVLGNRIVLRLGRRNVVFFGGLLVATGIAVAILSPWLWLSIAGFALAGMGGANVVPTLIATAGQTPGMEPSIAIGAVTTLLALGLLVGPPIIGFISHRLGLSVGICLMAVAGLAVALAAPFKAWPPVSR